MAAKLTQADLEYLKNYDPNRYPHPSVTVDILVFTVDMSGELELLLINRKAPPYQGLWAIPGGFVNVCESLEDAAKRELYEETGVKDVHIEQLYTFGDVYRDPRTRVISVSYMALVPKCMITPRAGDDAQSILWAKVRLMNNHLSLIDDIELGFDHEEIIKTAIERLNGKLSYTTIASNLLANPKRFSVFELQKIHEAILGKKLDAANFRRYFFNTYVVKGLARELDEICTEFSRRPSHYYEMIERNE